MPALLPQAAKEKGILAAREPKLGIEGCRGGQTPLAKQQRVGNACPSDGIAGRDPRILVVDLLGVTGNRRSIGIPRAYRAHHDVGFVVARCRQEIGEPLRLGNFIVIEEDDVATLRGCGLRC